MTLTQRWDQVFEKTTTKIKEQEWFNQVKNSYDQLAPEQQNFVKWGAWGGTILLFAYLWFSVLSGANSAKSDYYEKQDLLQTVNQASDELRRLKGQNAGLTQMAVPEWKSVFQGLVSSQGLSPESVEVIKETPGVAQNVIQEYLLEVQVKGIAPRVLSQLLFTIEHGTPPMKLKGMMLDTNPADGLLTAKLNVSGYVAKAEKTEKPSKK